MKVLLVNKFLHPGGGADTVTLKTGRLLESKKHQVIFWGTYNFMNPVYPYKNYFVPYVDFNKKMGLSRKIKATLNIFYSFDAENKIRKLIKQERPDIAHLNNFAHQISPSILNVFKEYGMPVVMTMHDYKMVCPSYTLWRDGRSCEKCRGGRYYNCFVNKCTRGSYAKSMVNTLEMYLHHKILGIYGAIDVFISPSMFMEKKLKDMGFKGKIVHLRNFLDLDDYAPSYWWEEKSIVYFGRISREKGLSTLIDAVNGLDINLKIIGSGNMDAELRENVKSSGIKNVYFLGYMKGEELKNEIKRSMAAVLPSEWNENNPMSVIESFGLGKPVIGSRIGGIPELIKDNVTGFTFETGNSLDLRNKITELIGSSDKIPQMGRNARKFAEENFDAERHYNGLMQIYELAKTKKLQAKQV